MFLDKSDAGDHDRDKDRRLRYLSPFNFILIQLRRATQRLVLMRRQRNGSEREAIFLRETFMKKEKEFFLLSREQYVIVVFFHSPFVMSF